MSIKKGDKVKIVNAHGAEGQYKNGDIFTVEQVMLDGDVYVKEHNRIMWGDEYEPYNPVNVGDKVRLIDKFYEHESFKSDDRYIRKQIASLKGKEFAVYAIAFGRAHTTADTMYTVPLELLEKVDELPKVPKPGDLFKVINNTSPRHFFNTGDVVRFVVFTNSSIYVCDRSDGRRQHVSPNDLEPYVESAHERLERVSTVFAEVFAERKHGRCKKPIKHRYTDDQIAEAQRIIGEIVANMAWGRQITFAMVDSNIIAFSWKNRYENTKEVFEAKCLPNDEYNEAIGKMVCLCKATGRKLPDWI